MQLKPIELGDKPLFDKYLSKYPQNISELTFTNLFVWRNSKKHEFMEIDNHLLIKSKDFFYQPIGPTPKTIIKSILEQFPGSSFERVEKKLAENLNSEQDRNNFDYLYNIQELIELKGNKFEPKRNLIKQCEKYEPEICPLDESTVKDFFQLQRQWCDLKTCEIHETLANENEAITEALNHFREFNLLGICIRKNNMIAGFAIGEKLNNNTFVEHFEKADTKFKGIYQFILREFCKAIPKEFTYLNREQDMGIGGLRKAKESYNPVELIEKYRIKK